jgi:hypothetical protein
MKDILEVLRDRENQLKSLEAQCDRLRAAIDKLRAAAQILAEEDAHPGASIAVEAPPAPRAVAAAVPPASAGKPKSWP